MKKDKYIKIFLILFSLVIFLAGISFHGYGSYLIDSENDFINSYIPHAEKFLNGNLVIDDFRGPLYYVFLGLVNIAVQNYFLAGILISSVSFCVMLLFIYGILKCFLDFSSAVIITLFTAFNPVFIKYGYAPGTDMFCSSLIFGSIYFLLKDFSIKNVSAASVLASFAFLTRYSSAVLLLIIPAAVFFILVRTNLKAKFRAAIISAAVIIYVVAPWGFYTWEQKGEIFYNENYKNIAITLENNGEFQYEEAWHTSANKYSSMSEIIHQKPVELLSQIFRNIIAHLYNDFNRIIGLHWSVFFIPGVFFLFKNPNKKVNLFLMIGTALFVILLPVFYSIRFSFVLIPFYGVICLSGLKFFFNHAKNFNRYISKGAFASILLIASLLESFHYNSYTMSPPEDLKKAVENVRFSNINIIEGEKIASLKPHIAYHLNLDWKLLPYDQRYSQTIQKLKNENVRYIFFSDAEEENRPYLNRLKNPDKVDQHLYPVMHLKVDGIILYEITAE